MALVILDNICVTLTSVLAQTDTVLPISAAQAADVSALIGTTGDHSYFTLVTPLGSEIMRVTTSGGSLFVQRAQGGTTALTGSVGQCVCFRYNKLILDEYVAPAPPCEPSVVSGDAAVIEVTPPASGACNWTVDLTDAFKARIAALETAVGNMCTLPDGVYENASITVTNGNVCSVSTGTNIVYTGGGCCGCS